MSQFSLDTDVAGAINDLKSRVAKLEAATFATMLTWHDVSFAAGYANIVGEQPCQVSRDQNGQVHLRGVLTTPAPAVNGATIFTIPTGFTPTEAATEALFPVVISGGSPTNTAAAIIHVPTSGVVTIAFTASVPTVLSVVVLGRQSYR